MTNEDAFETGKRITKHDISLTETEIREFELHTMIPPRAMPAEDIADSRARCWRYLFTPRSTPPLETQLCFIVRTSINADHFVARVSLAYRNCRLRHARRESPRAELNSRMLKVWNQEKWSSGDARAAATDRLEQVCRDMKLPKAAQATAKGWLLPSHAQISEMIDGVVQACGGKPYPGEFYVRFTERLAECYLRDLPGGGGGDHPEAERGSDESIRNDELRELASLLLSTVENKAAYRGTAPTRVQAVLLCYVIWKACPTLSKHVTLTAYCLQANIADATASDYIHKIIGPSMIDICRNDPPLGIELMHYLRQINDHLRPHAGVYASLPTSWSPSDMIEGAI